jgi:protein TonB
MISFHFVRRRNFGIVATVLLLHALALWGLQTGLLQRVLVLAEEIVIPVSVMQEPAAPAKPVPVRPPVPAKATQASPPAPPVATPTPAPVSAAPPVAQPAPAPLAVADTAPAAHAPQGVQRAATVAAAAAAPSARFDLPSSEADYLHNPKPKYPSLSISRNEQGTVRLSVLVGADGRARDVQVKATSGYERLDRAAREAVLGWTFVPGKRAGVPEEMWYELSMPFKLTE